MDTVEKRLPQEIKALIAKKSRNKGSNYERDVAKKIAAHFGWKWSDCFMRTSPHAYAQPEGDLKPINDMWALWKAANLGPLECKSRQTWNFDQLFKNPANSEIYRWWVKSNEDTDSDNSILFFTKNGVSDLVICQTYNISVTQNSTQVLFSVGNLFFSVVSLKTFLSILWPRD